MTGAAIVIRADARELPLPDGSVDLICTSPPYWSQRDYRDRGASLAGQIGSEDTPQAYLDALLEATAEWIRCLKPTGSLFVNLADSYYSGKGASTRPDAKNARRRGWARRWTAPASASRRKRCSACPGSTRWAAPASCG